MSHCVVPDWSNNLSQQRQEQLQKDQEKTNSCNSNRHKLLLQNPSPHLIPMSNYEVAELTWENGQLAMHGLGVGVGGPLHSTRTKPTWGSTRRTGTETLESIVHQATCHKQNVNLHHHQPPTPLPTSFVSSTHSNKWAPNNNNTPQIEPPPAGEASTLLKKRTRSSSDHSIRRSNFNGSNIVHDHEHVDRGACASAKICRDSNTFMKTWESPRRCMNMNMVKNTTTTNNNKSTDDRDQEYSATFCRDNDTTMMTWPSFESPTLSFKTKTTDEDSASHGGGSENQDEDRETKTQAARSHSITRRSRAAAVHNQSERRRRDRINQKMKTLQKLVPNASKTDKASMLDEVIDYLKQLQAQVQMMSNVRNNMPQMNMMMPLGMQQQLHQMSLLARMGMAGVGLGMGMGMLDMSTVARTAPQSLPQLIHPTAAATPTTFVPSPFVVSPMMTTHSPAQGNPDPATNSASVPLPDPYCSFLAQSMNMELYNKMAALYQQQVNQTTQAASSTPSHSNHVQVD